MPPAAPPIPPLQKFRVRRFAKARLFVVGGGVVLLLSLGLYWLKFGRIDGRGVSVAASLGLLVELFGVLKLWTRPKDFDPVRSQLMKMIKSASAGRASMTVQLCRSGLERLGPEREPLLEGLRARGHTAVVRECLNRCIDCKQGLLMANVESVPVSAPNPQQLLRDLDELSAEDG